MKSSLNRHLGLLSLAATGICSMLGASVYVVPFMIQRNVPGIGANVLYAFFLAAIPALFAAAAYAILASAMPRAGGSYIYASRGLNPYLGFIASFSQWFGLSIAIGVISYIIIPFFRDICIMLEWENGAQFLEIGLVRLGLSLAMLWSFVWVNIRGLTAYQKTLLPLMFVMFGLGLIVIITGFLFNHEDFATALQAKENRGIPKPIGDFSFSVLLTASALLFSSFIGFDAIAQAGGEAKNPQRNLPLAIGIAIFSVGTYYFIFTAAVYHAVPWEFVAEEAMSKDISAPGLLGYLLPPFWAVLILLGAAIALINDLPAMLLSVSRLMFAWASDGVFPRKMSSIHSRFHTPHLALLGSGMMASIGILGSHFAGDFFLGIDIMVTAMLINFLLMCITVISIATVNKPLHKEIKVFRSRRVQVLLASLGIIGLSTFLLVHIRKDLTSEVAAWYFHSTWVYLLVIGLASVLFFFQLNRLKRAGVSTKSLFKELPSE